MILVSVFQFQVFSRKERKGGKEVEEDMLCCQSNTEKLA